MASRTNSNEPIAPSATNATSRLKARCIRPGLTSVSRASANVTTSKMTANHANAWRWASGRGRLAHTSAGILRIYHHPSVGKTAREGTIHQALHRTSRAFSAASFCTLAVINA